LSGNYLGQYGLYGSALGEFNKPAKLFFDAFTSNLFAIDLSNNRIQYKDGADVWRSFVSGNEPISIASDNSCFYVLTRGNYKVTKYDRTDTSVTNQFGNYGMGSGQFLYPIDMTILNDSIVVLDNYSIQMFDNSGASKFKWNSYGRLKNPTSIAADNNQGYVYVTDAGKNAVKIYKMYNNADIIVYSFNNGSQPDSWPMKIARDPKNGFVYVATYSYYYDNIADEDHYRECIIKMNASMQNVLAIWGSADEYDAEASDLGNFANITNITTDKDGNLYVSESSPNYRIQKLAAGSNAWTLFAGGNGSGPADTQFQFVACISSDSQGNIYAFDRYLNRLSKYSSAGTLLNTTNLDYLYDNGYIDEALRYFTVSNNGNFYFLSTYASKVLVLNSNLQYVSQWGGYGFENEKFLWPIDIKSDSEGNIYVLDSDNSRISKFDSTGNFLKKWGTYGFDKLQFAYPYGIDVNNNYIWVADADNCRIQKFRQ
ncbi:MAG TPA: NHL repeat-containing protein, partial [bacterium]|nr:NHL repeat-containing protein [bacterium]